MSGIKFAILALSLSCFLLPGCRNCGLFNRGCCQQQFNPTIAAPGTGQIAIPRLGANTQPYYNNGAAATTAQQPNYLINPSGQSPTPATSSPSLAPTNGWRPVGSNNFSNTNTGTGNSRLASVIQGNQLVGNNNARFASNSSFGSQLGQFRNQSSPTPVNNPVASVGSTGTSVIESNNYQSTSVDERNDQTRLATTNATNVRAPSAIQLASNPYSGVSQYGSGTSYNANINVGQRGYANQQVPVVLSNQGQYQPQINIGNNRQLVNIQGVPVIGTTAASPTVLASSTVNYDPNRNGGNSVGWRDRDLTTR